MASRNIVPTKPSVEGEVVAQAEITIKMKTGAGTAAETIALVGGNT